MTAQRGFTLIELAIVLVIVTLLIGGLVAPLSAQIQARRTHETRQTLEEAREALFGYAMTHRTAGAQPRPYLPCPDVDGDGIEEARDAGDCPQDAGWFPWVTLGTAAQDAWGNRLHYAAHADLTSSTAGFHAASADSPSSPWNQVCSAAGCAVVDIAAAVPVVLVSHGANGWGARNMGGNTLAAPSGANEQENLDANGLYVSRPPSRPDDPSGEFDDLLAWIAFPQLIARVCPTGCAP